MKVLTVEQVRERIRNTHPRTRKAQLNTIVGLGIKGGGMLVSLLLVPLTIDYLSKETYGTWLTISSIVTMLTFFDIGIGNGLRNKFSEAITKQDLVLAKAYVSTAYYIFGLIQLVFICLFLLIFRFIPWQQILNTNINSEQIQIVVLLTAIGISVKLVLDILSYILFALQESGRVNLFTLLSNGAILFGIYLLNRYTSSNLLYVAILTAVSPLIVLLISSFLYFKNRLRLYQPSYKLAKLVYAKSLLSLGYQYFFIQMAVIVVFYTDNILITHLFGPSEVTTYNVAFRYFNAINTLFVIAIAPYWSAFTEAFIKNDVDWMKRTYRYLKGLWLGLIVVVALMIVTSDNIYSLWVGNRVHVPLKLTICMGLFIIVSCWNSVTVTVINGVGKVRLQLYYALLAAISNVPLAILFGRNLGMGSAGIILASSVSLLFGSVFGEIQARKLIAGTAKGIWGR